MITKEQIDEIRIKTNQFMDKFLSYTKKDYMDKLVILTWQKAQDEILNDEIMDDLIYDGIHGHIDSTDALEGIRDRIKSLRNRKEKK